MCGLSKAWGEIGLLDALAKTSTICVRRAQLTRTPLSSSLRPAYPLLPEPNGTPGCTLERDWSDSVAFREHQVRTAASLGIGGGGGGGMEG